MIFKYFIFLQYIRNQNGNIFIVSCRNYNFYFIYGNEIFIYIFETMFQKLPRRIKMKRGFYIFYVRNSEALTASLIFQGDQYGGGKGNIV